MYDVSFGEMVIIVYEVLDMGIFLTNPHQFASEGIYLVFMMDECDFWIFKSLGTVQHHYKAGYSHNII